MAKRSKKAPFREVGLDKGGKVIGAPDEGVQYDLSQILKDTPVTYNDDGTLQVEMPDGSLFIDTDPGTDDQSDSPNFDDNLAELLDDMELSHISSEILEGIRADEESRKDWLETRAKGISLLGLRIEEPRGDTGTSSAPLEGMATVRHPLLLEATVAFQAGARAELLPAKGPAKIRNDTPPGAPPGQVGVAPLDDLAQALETDFNHYLTAIAKEYVPDTDRMFFMVGFGGDGYKKLFHCPLRQRPVSESVDANDLIVSNAATDLSNCGRVTHKIKMRRSTMRRMQLIGAYRDVSLTQPMPSPGDPVEDEKAKIGGYRVDPIRPEDMEHQLYESYVELDLDRFAPKKLKGKHLPLPYKVTLDKDSRKVLEIRRNWREKDPMAHARRVFVQYPFIRGLGFYGLGFVHLLGNTTLALTAAWRLMLDAGMFANFPGFVYSKDVGRQLTNQFRCPPAGGIPLDVPLGKRIQDMIMPIPYKEVGPAFATFVTNVEDRAKKMAMATNVPVAEGKQDAPVGTTLALIEQATKLEASAFKRLHEAQAEEFQILVELFREDPEAMWRHNKQPAIPWHREQFLEAIDRYELVPVADPNNPTSLHRAMKGALLKTLQAANPTIYDAQAVDRRIMGIANIDPEGLFLPPPPPGQGDPMAQLVQAQLQARAQMMQLKAQETQLKAAIAAAQEQGKAADRASKEKIEGMKAQISYWQAQQDALMQRLKLTQEMYKHAHDAVVGERQQHLDHQFREKEAQRQHEMDMHLASQGQQHEASQADADRQHQANQSQADRNFQAGQSGAERKFNADQADQDRFQQTVESGAERQHQAQQSDADRQFQADQGDQDRQFQAQQSERQAQIKAKEAKAKPNKSGGKA